MPIFFSGYGGAGAYKLTATCSSEYIGAIIMATLGTKTVTAVVGENRTATLTLKKSGTWTISNSLNSYTRTIAVSLEAASTMDLWDATINITTSTVASGTTLSITNGTQTVTATVASGAASAVVHDTGTWTITTSGKTDTASVSVTGAGTYSAVFDITRIYTIKVTAAESAPYTRITYQDDAAGMTPVTVNQTSGAVNLGSWGDIFFLKNNYPVMLKYDGTEDYKLNPADYSKKLDGTASDITNASYGGNAMSFIPKFYSYARTDSSGNEYYSVSNKKVDSNYEAVGFKRSDGSEMDGFYWGMFFGSWDSSNRLRSISGTAMHGSTTMQQESDAAALNGTNWDVHAWAQRYAIELLWLLCFKNDNSQTAHGMGIQSYLNTSGKCNTSGPIGLDTGTKCVKFMHIEDLWGNKGDRIKGYVGIGVSPEKIMVKMAKPYNLTGIGYTQASTTTGGYISRSRCSNSFGRIPSVVSGSDSTYQCDYVYSKTDGGSYPCICGWYTDANGGLWYRDLRDSATYTYANLGAALSFEPPAA